MNAMRLVFGIAVAVILVGEGHKSELLAADQSTTNVTVEVIIFSGRPNPTWRLNDTNLLESLKGKLKDLPEAFKEEPAEWSRLGFAGFRIRGGETLGLPIHIRIYQGVIQAGHGKEAKFLKDIIGLEQSLLDKAKQQLPELPLRDAIESYEKSRKVAPPRK